MVFTLSLSAGSFVATQPRLAPSSWVVSTRVVGGGEAGQIFVHMLARVCACCWWWWWGSLSSAPCELSTLRRESLVEESVWVSFSPCGVPNGRGSRVQFVTSPCAKLATAKSSLLIVWFASWAKELAGKCGRDWSKYLKYAQRIELKRVEDLLSLTAGNVWRIN